ncbi:DUF6266 family protein [Pedobacter sp.]|uniref:DUF6266 family protein n=1 Tax=Pedobacter sp. TaxID=1411316 RepID=UPI003D7FC3B3
MGIQDKGAFGGFRNKTGPLVGHIVNGQNVITSIPARSNKPATVKQLDQRKKFGMVTKYLSWISALVQQGFSEHEPKQSAMNMAVRYNLKNAITGVSPDFTIDPAKVMFSQGKSPLPFNISVGSLVGGKLEYAWGVSPVNNYSKATDVVNLVVYNASKNQFVVLEAAATRAEMSFTLQLPAAYVGDTVNCYFNVYTADKKAASNSFYAGQVVVL